MYSLVLCTCTLLWNKYPELSHLVNLKIYTDYTMGPHFCVSPAPNNHNSTSCLYKFDYF